MSTVLTQTGALLVDAYRELNAKKLFWITMILSGLVVAVFGMFGINEKGLTFLWWEFPLPLFNANIVPRGVFYKFVFANIGVPIWLTWVATVLALISTASIIPDFIAGGAIELTLSKPIGRLRLFLTKFFTGLLFVALQVTVFTAACFMVIGIRGGNWPWGIWLAVPIVLLFFSYLFSFCTLMGLVTRSTIAALLITLLGWFICWGINVADVIFLQQREWAIHRVEQGQKTVAKREVAARKIIDKAKADGTEADLKEVPGDQDRLEMVNPLLKMARAQVRESEASVKTWKKWSSIAYGVKTFLPKTGETIALLDRHLLSEEDLKKFRPNDGNDGDDSADDEGTSTPKRRRGGPDSVVQDRMQAALRQRTVSWIIGTSIGFEVVILGIACIVFVKRDF